MTVAEPVAVQRIPTPKYAIGETVYAGSVDRQSEQLPCPDCLGSKQWAVTTPAGESLEAPCPRCSDRRYGTWRDLPSLTRLRWAPTVRQLTIGSVQIDTNAKDPVRYMCRETGIGSGQIYYESQVSTTEAEAHQMAAARAAELNAAEDQRPAEKLVGRISHVPTGPATDLESWHRVWNASYRYNRFREDMAEAVKSGDQWSIEQCLDWERRRTDEGTGIDPTEVFETLLAVRDALPAHEVELLDTICRLIESRPTDHPPTKQGAEAEEVTA